MPMIVAAPATAMAQQQGHDDGDHDNDNEDESILDFTVLPGSQGLCSPRKITANHYDDYLYVAEAGIGPRSSTNPDDLHYCFDGEMGGSSCIGDTSKVSKIPVVGSGSTGGPRIDVVTGLWSSRVLTGQRENQASGAQMVFVDSHGHDGTLYIVMGLGMNGTQLTLSNVQEEIGAFGAILEYHPQPSRSHHPDTTSAAVHPLVYPWEAEYASDYDGTGVVDSNPYHLLVYKDKFYVADAGCNCVMVYDRQPNRKEDSHKGPTAVLVMENYKGLKALKEGTDFGFCAGVTPPFGPPFCGQYQDETTGEWLMDVQNVPTAVRLRPNHFHKIYVSSLTGFPWSEPVAQIWEYTLDRHGYPLPESKRVVPGGPYWTVADFVFADEDTLYVLETNPGAPFIPFAGHLTKVTLATRKPPTSHHHHNNNNNNNNGHYYHEEYAHSVVPVQIRSSDPAIPGMLVAPSGIEVYQNHLYITDSTYNPSGPDGTCEGRVLVARLPTSHDYQNEEHSVGGKKKETQQQQQHRHKGGMMMMGMRSRSRMRRGAATRGNEQ
ncbi:hypothetical protein ACA910_003682 [Epithemia clementina (nom. ined.)]